MYTIEIHGFLTLLKVRISSQIPMVAMPRTGPLAEEIKLFPSNQPCRRLSSSKGRSALICTVLVIAVLLASRLVGNGADPMSTHIDRFVAGATDAKLESASVEALDADWWAAVQRDLARREYEAVPADPASLRAAATADIPGATEVLAAMGDDDRILQSPNRYQGLRTYYLADRIAVVPRISTISWLLSMRTTGIRRVGASVGTASALHDATPEVRGNRVEYDRGNLTEWYRNRPDGVEQGWTLAARPAGDGELRLTVAIAGLVAAQEHDRIVFRQPGRPGDETLRYGKLRVYDAAGRRLDAAMEAKPDQITIAFNDQDAVYPITIDPLLTTLPDIRDGEAAFDLFGVSVAGAGDVNGDGYADVIVGAQNHDTGNSAAGRAYVYYGSATGLSLTAPDIRDGEGAIDNFGRSVAGAGDVNGDGYADVIIGAPLHDTGGNNAGRVYVYFGSATGLASTPPNIRDGEAAGDQFGSAIAGAGDLDGDGYADVIVGAPFQDSGGNDAGRMYVYFGSPAGLSPTPPDTRDGEVAGDQFGFAVAGAGDVDGDGYADVIIGAPFQDTGGNDAGRLYVYFGSTTGVASAAPDTRDGEAAGDQFGSAIAGAGDVDGDGYADVVVGAPLQNAGRMYTYFGSTTGLSSAAPAIRDGEVAGDQFGFAVAGAGDVDGDGYADVIVGATQHNAGRTYVYSGSATGLSSAAPAIREGEVAGDQFGFAVAGAGDVNGDGFADVLVGAIGYDSPGTSAGRTYVYFGAATGPPPIPDWKVTTNQAGAHVGWSVAGAGDVNGDGYADVLVGVADYDNGQIDEGAAWLYLGGPNGLSTTVAWSAVETDQPSAQLGFSVAGIGDVNRDGYGDVAISARNFDNSNGGNAGRVYVYAGSATGLLGAPLSIIDGDLAGAFFGTAVAGAGDVNGDGYDDFVVGANSYDAPELDEGRVFVYAGSSSGPQSTPLTFFELNQIGAQLGYSVAGAGDVDGDGYDDIVVGAPVYNASGNNAQGRIIVYPGSASGPVATRMWAANGLIAGAQLGWSVAGAGDVNGDGYADIVAGAAFYDPPGLADAGRFAVYLGSATGMITSPVTVIDGDKANAQLGYSVAGAGDVDGDGYDDILVGARLYANPTAAEGRAYLYAGSATGLRTSPVWFVESNSLDARWGNAVAGSGDINGDGYPDLLVGASNFWGGAAGSGRAMVYYTNEGRARPGLARQWMLSGTKALSPGAVTFAGRFVATVSAATVVGRTPTAVAIEVKPATVPFDGRGMTVTEITFSDSTTAARLYSSIVTLPAQGSYHWRARLLDEPAAQHGAGNWGRWLRPNHQAWQTADVRFRNTPPAIVAAAIDTIPEGDPAAAYAVVVTVADPENEMLTVDIDCNGNGTYGELGEPTSSATPGTYQLACGDVNAGATGGPGQLTAVARVRDSIDQSVTATVGVTVVNVPPAITSVSNAGPIAEGAGTVTITVAANDPVDTLSYDYDCDGDGGFEVVGQGNRYDCPYNGQNGPGAFAVVVRVNDDTVSVTSPTSVAVDNVAPTLNSVQINGGPYSAISTIPCSVNANDPIDALIINYDWQINGTAMGVNQQSYSGNLTPGDKIRCLASVADADGGSAGPITSNEITLLTDRDGDGLPDMYEIANGLDPDDSADATKDPDSDGLTNTQEQAAGTNPQKADSDGDGLPDGYEVSHGLDPTLAADAALDTDNDGLTNLQEFTANTDPQKADTDGDGASDGDEVAAGSDPLDSSSLPAATSGDDAADTAGGGSEGATSGTDVADGAINAGGGGCSVAPAGAGSFDMAFVLFALIGFTQFRRRRHD
ncbi:MAG: hypothetical protein D6761_03215 [Candidatus Dadabacteria bacterium]|nr:MAG: hypothetical protein D6761_03215 [Candidatus Dadabacteria bacterium]